MDDNEGGEEEEGGKSGLMNRVWKSRRLEFNEDINNDSLATNSQANAYLQIKK